MSLSGSARVRPLRNEEGKKEGEISQGLNRAKEYNFPCVHQGSVAILICFTRIHSGIKIYSTTLKRHFGTKKQTV